MLLAVLAISSIVLGCLPNNPLMTVSNTSSLMSFQACMVASVDVSPSRADLATRPVEPDFTRCVGRGVGGVGVGMGHASLASYEGGRLSRAGKERTSLAHCVGKGVGGVGVGMGNASLASYEAQCRAGVAAVAGRRRPGSLFPHRWWSTVEHAAAKIEVIP